MRLPAAAGLVGATSILGWPVAYTACCTLPAQPMQGSCCSPGLQYALQAVACALLFKQMLACLQSRRQSLAGGPAPGIKRKAAGPAAGSRIARPRIV